jgi:hypothetical protein
LTIHAPPIQKTTTAYEVGLAPKRLAELFSVAPPSTVASTTTTVRASITGTREPTRNESGRRGPAAASSTTRTSVWIATPPIRLPTAHVAAPAPANASTNTSSDVASPFTCRP